MKKAITIALLLIINICLFGEITSELRKEGENWHIRFINNSSKDFEAMIVSSDPSYRSEEGSIDLQAGNTMDILIIKNESAGDPDKAVYLRLISDHPDNPGIIALEEKSTGVQADSDDNGLVLEYYYTPDCTRCKEFLAREVPKLEEELNISLSLRKYDVTTADGLNAMTRRLKALNSREKQLPIIVGGSTILAGDREIERELESLIRRLMESRDSLPHISGADTGAASGSDLALGIFPIIAAGLLDGINPCAFTTLIFLISWLGLAGRERREILITGLLFTAAVFITYYLVGLGAFAAVRSSSSIQWIGTLMKYIMAAVLLVLAVIHVLDYRKVKAGRSSEITLQLSRERKKKIHSLIRENTRKAGLFTGSIALGVGVTIYELGCTGQVYLPTLMYMARAERAASAFFLLGLYNLAFVFPLIIVFAAAWRGTGSEKLAQWFSENLGKVKLLSALFFLMMAGLLVIL